MCCLLFSLTALTILHFFLTAHSKRLAIHTDTKQMNFIP